MTFMLDKDAGERVRRVLEREPATWADIVAEAGVSKKGVYRWLARLGATRKAGDPRWELPAAQKDEKRDEAQLAALQNVEGQHGAVGNLNAPRGDVSCWRLGGARGK